MNEPMSSPTTTEESSSSSMILLSEWITRTIDQVDRTSTSLSAASALAPNLRKSMILCSDDYLLSALRVSYSLAHCICLAEEEEQGEGEEGGKKLLLPIPSVHWSDGIAVGTTDRQQHEEGGSTTEAENRTTTNNILRAEFVPLFLCNTYDNEAEKHTNRMQRIYSLGIVLYEIFSGGERPLELLGGRAQTAATAAGGGVGGGGGSNNTTLLVISDEEKLNFDPLPFDSTLAIDLDDNHLDELFEDITTDDHHPYGGGIDTTTNEDNDNEEQQQQQADPKKKRQSSHHLRNHHHNGSNNNNNNNTTTTTSIHSSNSNISLEPLASKWIPGPLCDLIANMLDSTNGTLAGEDSYKSMADVRDDIQLMLERPEIFLYDQDMGRLAVTGLQFPTTAFGRNAELSTIKESYRRSMMGDVELVIISGPSGSGKSLLALEFGRYVTAGGGGSSSSGGVILSGKFDQLQQGKPFSALASAFDSYCDNLMKDCSSSSTSPSSSNNIVKVLASKLIATLGGEAYHLAKMIPNLALILGPDVFDNNHDHQEEVCDHPQERLEYLLCQFVEVISSASGAPVTLFLDDLQWADAASIAAVNQLLFTAGFSSSSTSSSTSSSSSLKRNKQFFFYGCCREGAIDKKHPVWKVFCRAKFLGVKYINVKLGYFEEDTLNAMVSETLRLPPRLTRSLSSVIYHKTKGNPLFVSQLMLSLSKEGLLRPSLSRRRWEWDKEKIQSQKLPDDVAMFITKSMQAQPEGVKSAICVLSCFGASAENTVIKMLERALNKNLVDNLDLAVKEGFLDKTGDQYRFSHDRIQEAAYNMMKFVDRCHFHFFYGMALAPSVNGENDDSTLLIAANQINLAGTEAVRDKSQNAVVANLNLSAGKKAMEMSDFVAAYSYFDNGISFLRKKHWEEHYALSLELFDLAAKCALSNGDIVSLQLLYEQVVKYGRTFEDKLNVMYFSTCALAFSSRLRESIEKGLDILSKLGIDLRGDESSMEACVRETKDLLTGYTDHDILSMRRMTDPTMIIAMKFLGKMVLGMTQIMPKSVAHVTQRIIQLSLLHGISPVSPVGFVHFGTFIAKFGDINGGYHYVKLARSLLDKVGSRESAGEVIAMGTQIVAYVEPVQAALEHHHEGYAAALASGDVIQASVNGIFMCINSFFAGLNLQTVQEKFAELIHFMDERKQIIFMVQMQCAQHSVFKLIGSDEEPKSKYVSEGQDILATNNSVMTSYYFQKAFVSFFFRSYDETKENIGNYLACVRNTWANLFIAHAYHAFYIGLVFFWLARKSGDQQWSGRGKLSKLALKQWAESSSWTFENKWYLLEAEESFCCNNFDAAKIYYEKAISSARDHKFINEEALACELAAYFYLELGQKDKALELFLVAHEKYHEWGAFGKCTSLFEFVGSNFTSFIGPGISILYNNTAQELASPNPDDGLLSSLDDALQRHTAS